jgi:hypothetical protein
MEFPTKYSISSEVPSSPDRVASFRKGDFSSVEIVRISDVTDLARAVHRHVAAGRLDEAESRLPREVPYPLPERICERIGGTAGGREQEPSRT